MLKLKPLFLSLVLSFYFIPLLSQETAAPQAIEVQAVPPQAPPTDATQTATPQQTAVPAGETSSNKPIIASSTPRPPLTVAPITAVAAPKR